MTRFNFTIQDNSPFLSYTGSWRLGTVDDDLASAYDGSFTVTDNSGAKAAFNFVGTGASIFGAFRPNHGEYSVDLDQSGDTTSRNGTGPNKFQVPLWSAYGLDNKAHTVEVTNVPVGNNNAFFDVDFISIERVIGQDGGEISNSTIDDTAPEVQYQGSWSTDAVKPSQNHNFTLHSTATAGAQADITFRGCCIEIYGSYANAPYSVSLDNQPPTNMQGIDRDVDLLGNTMSEYPQTLLYLMDGLSEDTHTVSLRANQGTSQQRPFSFDYAVSRSAKTNYHSGLSQGARIGLGVALPLGMLIVLGLVAAFLLRRRRRRTHPVSRVDLMASKLEPYDVVHNPPWLSLRHAAPRSDATFQFSSVISGWGPISAIDDRSDTDQRRASTRWGGSSGTSNSRWESSSGAPSTQRGSIPPPPPPKAVTHKPRKGDVMRGRLQLSRPRESIQTASGVPPAYDPSWDSQSSSQH